ncbi:Major outer membrane protein precursor [Aliarcobacter thereius]|uniref:Major outer membrane protein n=1 Tax=Aliarcobacter thereius TaxID=544718 RepID=A0A1C0B5Z9_9BACT|nr:porin [Aliarcobacter thereius]OCL98597.1 Major outer membrane protein precursor [Aliarcobacter thereius]
MKKFTKLSLVAAVAVAGLTSASAKPLEEAIKNVDVSGTVTYRYDNFGDDNGKGQLNQDNKYKINLNLSSKVNDYVTFNSRFNVVSPGLESNNDFAGMGKNDPDLKPEVGLAHAYFGFTGIANTTVNVGKQGLATPWTVATDNDGGEQTGTGIFSVTAVDNFVVGLAYFNQTNINTTVGIDMKGYDASNNEVAHIESELSGADDIYAATLQANYGFVNAEAWYLKANDQFDTYTLAVHGKVKLAENANIGYEVRYVSLSLDSKLKNEIGSFFDSTPAERISRNGVGDDNSLLRFAVNGKFGIVNARVAYSITDKDGGLTALDTDAQNASLGWRLNTLGKADAKFLQTTVGADVLDNLNLSLNYNTLEYDNGTKVDQDELFAQLTYKMSKNLDGYIRYGQQDFDNGNEQNSGRLQVNYKF